MFLWYNDRALGRVFTGIETPVWPIVILSRSQTRNRSFMNLMRGNMGGQSQFVANPVRVRVLRTYVSSSPVHFLNSFEYIVQRVNEMRRISTTESKINEKEQVMEQDMQRWKVWRHDEVVTRRVSSLFVNARNDFAAWMFVMCKAYVFETPYGMAIWFSETKTFPSNQLRRPSDSFEKRHNENRRPHRRRRSWPSYDSLCRIHLLNFDASVQAVWRDVRWCSRVVFESGVREYDFVDYKAHECHSDHSLIINQHSNTGT